MASQLRAKTLEWGWEVMKWHSAGWLLGDSRVFYVYLQCNTACLELVHRFLFRTEYGISETRSVLFLTLKGGEVPTQLFPLDECTGV